MATDSACHDSRPGRSQRTPLPHSTVRSSECRTTAIVHSRRLIVRSSQLVLLLLFSVWTLPGAAAIGNDPEQESRPGNTASYTVTKSQVDGAPQNLSVLLVSFDRAGHTIPILSLGEALLSRGHRVSMLLVEEEESDHASSSSASSVRSMCEQRGIGYLSAGKTRLPTARKTSGVRDFVAQLRRQSESFGAVRNVIMSKLISERDGLLESVDVAVVDFLLPNVMKWLDTNTNLSVAALTLTIPFAPALLPAWYYPIRGPTPPNPTFLHRLGWVLREIALKMMTTAFKSMQNLLIETPAGVRIPDLVTTSFAVDYPRPLYPMSHFVGPVTLLGSGLPSSLQAWLDGHPPHSVVYLSMGSYMQLGGGATRAVVLGVMESGHHLLWSLKDVYRDVLQTIDSTYLSNQSRILILNWVPQAAALNHPSIAMAALHGGSGGVNEALLAGVPILCLPQAIDQPVLCGRVHHRHLGVSIGSDDNLVVSEVVQAIHRVKECRSNARKVSKIFKKAGGASKAVELIEYYHEIGYDHLVPAWAKYNWTFVQYYNLDVYCVAGVLVWVVVQAARRAGRACRRKCARKTKTTKTE